MLYLYVRNTERGYAPNLGSSYSRRLERQHRLEICIELRNAGRHDGLLIRVQRLRNQITTIARVVFSASETKAQSTSASKFK